MAKVATVRKLLEWIYHMMRDGKTFKEVEKLAEFLGKGELAKQSGLYFKLSISRQFDWVAPTRTT